MKKANLFIKRIFDIVCSVTGILLLLPFWIGISAAVKRDSEGPVLFKQERRTKDGRIFTMLKFRSMVVDAEHRGAGLFNYEKDPRVTGTGRKLRDTSLDELPQLFNILKGDMSLVGPRPCVAYELGDYETLNRKYKKRFRMKAGLTGLAQVRGRNNIPWDEKVAYDNQYVDSFHRFGILADIRILLETAGKAFRKECIYEHKADRSMNDEEAAGAAQEEVIRLAHLPD